MKKLLLAALLLMCANGYAQKFAGLAKTPQMGWNSWNTFAVNISEQLVKDVADAFIALGLKDAGYEYLVLDDGWMAMERDASGNLVPHPDKFPNGIKAAADYVHAKGLKFGIYNCAGWRTCGGYPGSKGHEYQDALKYAEWGVDYLKYDWCNTASMSSDADKETYAAEAYTVMSDALRAAGRPVLFSLCEWGSTNPWKWAAPVGHSWRTTGDIHPCFDCVKPHGDAPSVWYSWGVIPILNMRNQDSLRRAAGSGRWNDMDMLEVGNEGLSLHENQSHFALWALLSSPLMLGNDLRSISKETLSIITNKEIIALNQDTLGIQGFRYKSADSVEVWAKPLAEGQWALLLLNRATTPTTFTFDWAAEKITDSFAQRELSFGKNSVWKVRDLHAGKDLGNTTKALKSALAPHQSLVLRLTK
ncbi:MAG: glycoside hydrolase family 27 protein [Prevotellaceae bacterium]|jgi:alpha-galactosidase|nr:glycoside hydrolase family 27 protein [Prevotellaceae bacterium]